MVDSCRFWKTYALVFSLFWFFGSFSSDLFFFLFFSLSNISSGIRFSVQLFNKRLEKGIWVTHWLFMLDSGEMIKCWCSYGNSHLDRLHWAIWILVWSKSLTSYGTLWTDSDPNSQQSNWYLPLDWSICIKQNLTWMVNSFLHTLLNLALWVSLNEVKFGPVVYFWVGWCDVYGLDQSEFGPK